MRKSGEVTVFANGTFLRRRPVIGDIFPLRSWLTVNPWNPMPRTLDFYICESVAHRRWSGIGDKYACENPRLVSAIVRRFIENEIRHDTYNRVNVVFSDAGDGIIRQEESTHSKKWIDIWYGVSAVEFNSFTQTERERTTADAIFKAASCLFGDGSPEQQKVDAIRREFSAYHETKVAYFKCRTKETKTYRVDVTFTISWGEKEPFWVASITHETIGTPSVKRRTSFPLRGTDDDIFYLCGRIAVSKGEIVCHPRVGEIQHLKRLKYDIPLRIRIDEMEEF